VAATTAEAVTVAVAIVAEASAEAVASVEASAAEAASEEDAECKNSPTTFNLFNRKITWSLVGVNAEFAPTKLLVYSGQTPTLTGAS
jgi:hypothetical protein